MRGWGWTGALSKAFYCLDGLLLIESTGLRTANQTGVDWHALVGKEPVRSVVWCCACTSAGWGLV